MNDNDFIETLCDYINTLDLPLKARLDYLNEDDDLVIYALPGGKVDEEDMAGTQVVSLPYEIAIKCKNQEVANATLWRINTSLSSLGFTLPSQNESYTFLNLNVETPSLNNLDEQDFYIYLLDITAKIEIERS